jgi:hypothetical protein
MRCDAAALAVILAKGVAMGATAAAAGEPGSC